MLSSGSLLKTDVRRNMIGVRRNMIGVRRIMII